MKETISSVPPAADADLLSIQDVARSLGCCDKTVKKLIEDGGIPAPFLFSARRRWHRKTIDAWLEERVAKPQTREYAGRETRVMRTKSPYADKTDARPRSGEIESRVYGVGA